MSIRSSVAHFEFLRRWPALVRVGLARTRRIAVTSGALLCLALHPGCATVVKGTRQDVPIASDPSGARIFVNGTPAGVTPTSLALDRKRSHLVTLEKENYEIENIPVLNSVGRAVAGNIIAGGLVGWGVDAVSGAQYNLHPSTVNVRLRSKPAAPGGAVATRTETLAAELAQLDGMRQTQAISAAEHQRLRLAVLQRFERTAGKSERPVP